MSTHNHRELEGSVAIWAEGLKILVFFGKGRTEKLHGLKCVTWSPFAVIYLMLFKWFLQISAPVPTEPG